MKKPAKGGPGPRLPPKDLLASIIEFLPDAPDDPGRRRDQVASAFRAVEDRFRRIRHEMRDR